MGVIRVQASLGSIISYGATTIAAISSLWIYPLDDLEAYGLAQILVSAAMFSIPFVTAGTVSIVVKFFPQFREKGLADSYLFNVLLLSFGATVILMGLTWLIDKPIILFLEVMGFDVHLILNHKYHIALLIALALYNQLLQLHASNYNKIAWPSLFQNLLPKIALPILVLGVYYDVIDIPMFTRLWILSFALPAIGLTVYLYQIGGLDLKMRPDFFRKEWFKPIAHYSGFVGFNAMGSVVVSKVDIIMVGALLGVKEAGLYTIALFIANVLFIPATSIYQIASPVISDAFKRDDRARISEIYKKSSLNLILLGAPLYFLILGSLDEVLHLSPKYEVIQGAVSLFAVIGLAKLIQMTASVNQQIIMFSRNYRFVVLFVAVMAVVNVTLNYVLILRMGVIGAAVATVTAMLIYSLIKIIFIQVTMKMHPFTATSARIGLIVLMLTGFYFIMPPLKSDVLDVLVYTTGVALIYFGMVRILNIESELIDTLKRYVFRLLR